MNPFPELSSFGALTPWGLVLVMLASFFVSLNMGRLYTRGQHLESMKSKDEIIAIYKAAAEKAEAGLVEQVRQNGLLVNQGEAFTHFIRDADRVKEQQAPSLGYSGDAEGNPHVRT